MQQKLLQKELEQYPHTTQVTNIKGNKYIVVSVYAGNKDFKKIFCDLAYKQALSDLQKSV